MKAEDRQKLSELMVEVEQLNFANDLNQNALKVQTDKTEVDKTIASILHNEIEINDKREQINIILLELP